MNCRTCQKIESVEEKVSCCCCVADEDDVALNGLGVVGDVVLDVLVVFEKKGEVELDLEL